ncbi:DUF2267 domain-containing protein [Plantactinospora sp. KBS50]|uniref:DUF2267 domain-containing protein n=1 Tax=Plantactinospora sp. KBS50 TaxID=2024580 RepID=UPI000BAAC29E|nr:DUF2267 domain-containing protein [Plantactinospora sp. KBS50]ASW54988.1 hypothetical protein CIK06_13495 [Plantactinospora sp. KBS50]
MNYDTFVDLVSRRARVPSEQAVELSRATLETLNDRLTAGEALDLAAQLPLPLQGLLRPPDEQAEHFDAAEFARRVAERAGVTEPAARDAVRALFETLHEAVTGDEFNELVARLPDDYQAMIEPSPARVVRHS